MRARWEPEAGTNDIRMVGAAGASVWLAWPMHCTPVVIAIRKPIHPQGALRGMGEAFRADHPDGPGAHFYAQEGDTITITQVGVVRYSAHYEAAA